MKIDSNICGTLALLVLHARDSMRANRNQPESTQNQTDRRYKGETKYVRVDTMAVCEQVDYIKSNHRNRRSGNEGSHFFVQCHDHVLQVFT